MTYRFPAALALTVLLAGCGGNPFGATDGDGDGTGGTGTNTIPANLKVNVGGASYSDRGTASTADDTLSLMIAGLDSTPTTVQYVRDQTLDVPGYVAFKMQEDALDRMFIALAAESQDGSVRAVTAADGGQFQRYYGGGYYERTGAFDKPAIGTGPGAGQVSYAGAYAGVANGGAPNTHTLPVPPGTDPSLVPDQPGRITGDIFLNANFADGEMLVNGSIYNRVIADTGYALGDVILLPASIAEDGTFAGNVEGPQPNVGTVTGGYGGIFGGTDAASVAGLVHLTAFDDAFENEQEHGVFVLTQCGLPGDDPICAGVAP